MEFCLAKWWANIGQVETSYTVTFHGVKPSNNAGNGLVMHGGEGIMRIELDSQLKAEEVAATGLIVAVADVS